MSISSIRRAKKNKNVYTNRGGCSKIVVGKQCKCVQKQKPKKTKLN